MPRAMVVLIAVLCALFFAGVAMIVAGIWLLLGLASALIVCGGFALLAAHLLRIGIGMLRDA